MNNIIKESGIMRDKFPLSLAILLLFLLTYWIYSGVLQATGGIFMYALDDPFIHMQVARNLAENGTWGINPGEFGSASSSLLYTVLLASMFFIFGVHEIIPFLINLVAAVWLLFIIDRWLKRKEVSWWGRTVIGCLVVLLAPLPVLIVSGMEHILQCVFSLLFLTALSAWCSTTPEKKGRWLPLKILVYAMLVTAIRYEGLFLIAAGGLALLYYRKWLPAIQLGIFAIIPLVLFGIISVAKGSYFLPNSVLIKSDELTFSLRGIAQYLQHVLIQKLTVVKALPGASPATPPPGISLLSAQRLLLIVPIAYLFLSRYVKSRAYGIMTFLLFTGILLHLIFASTGWFYRYEAYLIVMTIVLAGALISTSLSEALNDISWAKKGLIAVVTFFLFFPFILRSTAGFSIARQACINIYDQQYHMGQLVADHFKGSVVAANDIGAVSFYGGAKVIDLWGLGNIEIAKSKKGKYWTPEFLDQLVRREKVRVIMVYDEWFDPALLSRWTKCGSWRTKNNVILGGDVVSFYALDPEDAAYVTNILSAK